MLGGLAGYGLAAAIDTSGYRLLPERVTGLAHVDEGRLRAALAAADRVARTSADTARNGSIIAAGATLAEAIRFSRAEARAQAQPIPPEIREALAPYFPADMLDRVRWTIEDGSPTLGTVLTRWYVREGAVTLGDTIVFANEEVAANLGLWAHELTHVRQYQLLGVEDFARLYLVNWPALEAQAYQNGARVLAELRREAQEEERVTLAAQRLGLPQ